LNITILGNIYIKEQLELYKHTKILLLTLLKGKTGDVAFNVEIGLVQGNVDGNHVLENLQLAVTSISVRDQLTLNA
jgi:hypothetical protein